MTPTFGKNIRIYLKDGTVTGIRFGEIINQTIQLIACPRSRVTELKGYEEAKKQGIYFLFGNDEKTGDNKASPLLVLLNYSEAHSSPLLCVVR